MLRVVLCVAQILLMVLGLTQEPSKNVETKLRGVYTLNGRLYVGTFGSPDEKPITTGPGDMKPSWSKTGDMIVFFRLTKYAPQVTDWKTAICVVKADGSGFRKLTDGTHTDFNPTWTRDGTNMVIFSRRDPTTGKFVVMMTKPDAKPGDEYPVSDPRYSTFACSSLKDGRIVVVSDHPLGAWVYLMTPGKDGKPPIYEPVRLTFRPNGLIDRCTISPSETKIAYELQPGKGPYRYEGRTIYIADFEAKTRIISNPKPITDTNPDPKVRVLYPCWTRDESAVVYHCDKTGVPQLYMYRLSDGKTICVSSDPKGRYLYPCGEAMPK